LSRQGEAEVGEDHQQSQERRRARSLERRVPPEPAARLLLAVAPFDATQAKEYQRQTAEYLGVPVQKTIDLGRGVKMEFVLIPGGEFMMGSKDSAAEVARKGKGEEKWYTDEHPQHIVRISGPFYMGKFEVTQAQYRAIMGSNPSHFKGNEKELPVEIVSWDEAVEFCRKLSKTRSADRTTPTKRFENPSATIWSTFLRAFI